MECAFGPRRQLAWFAAGAGVLYGFLYCVAAAAEGGPGTLPWRTTLGRAVALDLVLTAPLLFAALALLRGQWPIQRVGWCAAALLGVGVLTVPLIAGDLPVPLAATSGAARLGAALVLSSAAFVFLRWWTRTDGQTDPIDLGVQRAQAGLGTHVVARWIGRQLTVLGLGFASWGHPRAVPKGAQAIGQHRRSLHGEMIFGLLVASVGELVAAHVLLARWSETFAWVATALSAYGSVWLVADYRAAVLCPLLKRGASVSIRAGLRFQTTFRRDNALGFSRVKPQTEALSLVLIGEPEQWLVFAEPVDVHDALGQVHRVRALGVTLDEPNELGLLELARDAG